MPLKFSSANCILRLSWTLIQPPTIWTCGHQTKNQDNVSAWILECTTPLIKIDKYYRTNSCIILLKHINISKTSSIRRNKSMDHPFILNTTQPWLLQILLIHYSPSSTSPHCPTLSFILLNRVWYALLSGSNFKTLCAIYPWVLSSWTLQTARRAL